MKPRGRTMLLRCTAALLALSYEAVSTSVAFVVMDCVSPSRIAVAASEPAGAEHACGCSPSEQRAQCCCAKDAAAAVCTTNLEYRHHDTPDDRHAAYMNAMRCAGQGPIDSDLALNKLSAHLLPVLPGIAPITDEAVAFALLRPISILADPPDKIPI